jgi:hypothetical protein
MQYYGSSKDSSRKEAERKDLQTLVGTNLVNVANLDGVDDQMYLFCSLLYLFFFFFLGIKLKLLLQF